MRGAGTLLNLEYGAGLFLGSLGIGRCLLFLQNSEGGPYSAAGV